MLLQIVRLIKRLFRDIFSTHRGYLISPISLQDLYRNDNRWGLSLLSANRCQWFIDMWICPFQKLRPSYRGI